MTGLVNFIHLVSAKDTGGPIWFSLIWVLGALDVFLMVIFSFGVLSNVYNDSKQVLGNIRVRLQLKRNKWFKSWPKSCPALRIYFGGANYLDRIPPLNIHDFVINQTVS